MDLWTCIVASHLNILSISLDSHLEAPAVKEAPKAATKPVVAVVAMTPFRQSPQQAFFKFLHAFFPVLFQCVLFETLIWEENHGDSMFSASLMVHSVAGTTTSPMCAPCRQWRCSCDGLQHAVDSTGIRSTMNSVLLKLFLTHIDSTARTWRVRDLFLPENLRKVPCAAKTGIETSSCLTLSPGNPSTCATLQLTCEDSLDPAGCFRSRNRGGAVMA
jgi:hypothetical protein